MKITLNLSPAASIRDRYALAWAVPATVVGLVALVLLVRGSLGEFRDVRGIESQLSEVQMRADALHNQESAIRRKLEDPAYRDLLRQAKFVNKLIDERELSLTEVTSRVTGLLPEGAHLTGLALTSPKKPGDDYMVRIGINAKDEDAVETFINDLEDSVDFKDVSILNQGFSEESAQGEQVNVICTARYLPGAERELEAQSQEPEAGSEKPEVANPAAAAKTKTIVGKTPAAKTASSKSTAKPVTKPAPKPASKPEIKGAGNPSAKESTPNNK